MDTCFNKGFNDIPAKKYYKYHGLIMPCNIQPDPVCFSRYDTKDPYGPPITRHFSAYYDVGWNYGDFNYIDAHNHVSGGIYGPYIGQTKEDFGGGLFLYQFYRMGVVWDTVILPWNCKINSASILLTITDKWSGVLFDIVVRNGMPTFPHTTDHIYDYYYDNYWGDFGRKEITDPGSFEIKLTDMGLLLINKTGYTKFALISSHDINYSIPTANDTIGINGLSSYIRLKVVYQELL